jgi:hypothetical protein
VYMCGAAFGYENFLSRVRIADMTHSGVCPPCPSSSLKVRGVFRALSGVLGVFRVEAGAEVLFLRGVCGSRGVVDAGNALLR